MMFGSLKIKVYPNVVIPFICKKKKNVNRYIYTGTLSTDGVSLVNIVVAADELEMLDVSQQLEERLLKSDSDWRFPKDFITICQHDHFTNLYKVALRLVCRNPKILFETKDFLTMEKNILIRLLRCDDLELDEIEIWNYLIKWGIENTDFILDDDSTEWEPTDFMNLENIIHDCIPHIRFYH